MQSLSIPFYLLLTTISSPHPLRSPSLYPRKSSTTGTDGSEHRFLSHTHTQPETGKGYFATVYIRRSSSTIYKSTSAWRFQLMRRYDRRRRRRRSRRRGDTARKLENTLNSISNCAISARFPSRENLFASEIPTPSSIRLHH